LKITLNAYFADMFGGMLKKMGCMIRLYEHVKGSTDSAITRGMDILYNTFLFAISKEVALKKVIEIFEAIHITPYLKYPRRRYPMDQKMAP